MPVDYEEAISAEERQRLPRADFGDPKKRAFPIRNQEDLHSAASLMGKAVNPAAVKMRIAAIAKRKGLTLPKAWQGESAESATAESTGATFSADDTRDLLQRAIENDHDPDTDGDDDHLEPDADWRTPWVQDHFPDTKQFAYSYGGQSYQRDYDIDPKGVVTLGKTANPVRRRVSYDDAQPMGVAEAGSRHSNDDTLRINAIAAHAKQSIAENNSILGHIDALTSQQPSAGYMGLMMQSGTETIDGDELAESAGAAQSFSEVASVASNESDASQGILEMVVIRPGFNVGKGRYYQPKALAEAVQSGLVGAGLQMMLDHATSAEERSRPEGSVRDLAGVIREAWVGKDGEIRAKAVIVNEQFKQTLANMQQGGVLGHIGVSIRAQGTIREGTIEGTKTNVVEGFTGFRSVDFVTQPGAGGKPVLMESTGAQSSPVTQGAHGVDEKQVTEAITAAVAVVESRLTAAERRADVAEAALASSEQRATMAELRTMLKESKLPATAYPRIERQFKDATSIEGVAEAIADEEAYIAQIIPARGGVVRGVGESRAVNASKATDAKLNESLEYLLGKDYAKVVR